jgi:hypothetical protein
MLKHIVILGVAYWAFLSPNGPDKAGGGQKDKGSNVPPPAVAIVGNSSRQTEADAPDKKSPETHTGIEWANWALVVVGLVTFFAVYKQAKESGKATKAMKDSLTLQEKALEQWVELSSWRSELVRAPPDKDVLPLLLVKVEIVNKTGFPVTLKKAEICLVSVAENVRHTYFAGDNTFLPPNSPHEALIAIELTAQQVSHFQLAGIGIQVTGSFLHVGALKRPVVQEFSGLLVCQQAKTEFIAQLHMNPKSPDSEQAN